MKKKTPFCTYNAAPDVTVASVMAQCHDKTTCVERGVRYFTYNFVKFRRIPDAPPHTSKRHHGVVGLQPITNISELNYVTHYRHQNPT